MLKVIFPVVKDSIEARGLRNVVSIGVTIPALALVLTSGLFGWLAGSSLSRLTSVGLLLFLFTFLLWRYPGKFLLKWFKAKFSSQGKVFNLKDYSGLYEAVLTSAKKMNEILVNFKGVNDPEASSLVSQASELLTQLAELIDFKARSGIHGENHFDVFYCRCAGCVDVTKACQEVSASLDSAVAALIKLRSTVHDSNFAHPLSIESFSKSVNEVESISESYLKARQLLKKENVMGL